MTNSIRYGIFLPFFLLFSFFSQHQIFAQGKIEVVSFQRMETDITARVTAPKRDQNGELCALIRIVTTVKDLMFEPDALGITARENKPGEIWLYVPRGARRISIMHDQYGVLRNYFYPDIIDKSTVYEMEVRVNDGTSQAPVDTNTQLLVMRPEPADATVYIDDEKVPTEKGLFTATMKKGSHTYRVESPMYAPEAGVIDLGSEQKIMSVTLKPKFSLCPNRMPMSILTACWRDRPLTRVTVCLSVITVYALKRIFSFPLIPWSASLPVRRIARLLP